MRKRHFFTDVLGKHSCHTIRRLAEREIRTRVAGTYLGFLHYLLLPLLMLAVYTLVFSQVFVVRWTGATGASSSVTDFALRIYSGLIPFQFFAEVLVRAPGLVLANPTYVKKVVFPLEVLVPVSVITAAFVAATGYIVFFMGYAILEGLPPITCLWLVVLWIPLLLFTCGLAWVLASLGVYLRDIGQLIGAVVSAMMFLTPIFYPLQQLPDPYRTWLGLNPLAFIIEAMRACLFDGANPSPARVMAVGIVSLFAAQAGYWFFVRTKKGFADVV